MDTDPQRKHPKGKIIVDHLVIYGLRDSGGRRFCVCYYGHYGERWLTERKHGLFVVLPRPIEQFSWGGLTPARRSPEEVEITKLLAHATHNEADTFLKPVK